MNGVQQLRVVYALPPRPSPRFRVRQVLLAFVRIQLSEPTPGVFVLNRAGVPRRLFDVSDRNAVEAKARNVAAELESITTAAFCDRYRIPPDFLDATEIQPKRFPQLHPLL